jgi:hypothetical protein
MSDHSLIVRTTLEVGRLSPPEIFICLHLSWSPSSYRCRLEMRCWVRFALAYSLSSVSFASMMISRLEDPPVFFDRARAHYRGRSAEERVTGRQAQSKALVDGLKIWLEGELVRVSGKSVIAAAIRYGLRANVRRHSGNERRTYQAARVWIVSFLAWGLSTATNSTPLSIRTDPRDDLSALLGPKQRLPPADEISHASINLHRFVTAHVSSAAAFRRACGCRRSRTTATLGGGWIAARRSKVRRTRRGTGSQRIS